MRFRFRPSFLRSIKSADKPAKEIVKETLGRVVDYYTTGLGSRGLGITRLRGNFWEARAGLATRILWRKQADIIEFVLAGNHDEVKRFLKVRA